MKKFCFILCCTLMLPMLLVGCKDKSNNDNNNFITVQSITYAIGNENTTLKSYWKINTNGYGSYYFGEVVSQTEYTEYLENINSYTWHPYYTTYLKNKEYNIKFTGIHDSEELIDTKKSNIPDLNLEYYYHCDPDAVLRKIPVLSVEVFYLEINIIQDNIIEIKNKDGSISKILCDSYQINYFI